MLHRLIRWSLTSQWYFLWRMLSFLPFCLLLLYCQMGTSPALLLWPWYRLHPQHVLHRCIPDGRHCSLIHLFLSLLLSHLQKKRSLEGWSLRFYPSLQRTDPYSGFPYPVSCPWYMLFHYLWHWISGNCQNSNWTDLPCLQNAPVPVHS